MATKARATKAIGHGLKQGDWVIFRARDAGVWYGRLESLDFKACVGTLANARQMWRWFAGQSITLLDVAEYGVDPTKCRFSKARRRATMLSVCAVVGISEAAVKTLEAVNA